MPVGDLELPELRQLAIEFALVSKLFVCTWGKPKALDEDLLQWAQVVNVDAPAIESKVRADLASGKKKAGKKAKGAVPVESVEIPVELPEPDAEGRFSASQCETLRFGQDGAEATIYVVLRNGGWTSSFEASAAGVSEGGLPISCAEIHGTQYLAVLNACEELATWCVLVRGRKNKKQVDAIARWATQQRDYAEKEITIFDRRDQAA